MSPDEWVAWVVQLSDDDVVNCISSRLPLDPEAREMNLDEVASSLSQQQPQRPRLRVDTSGHSWPEHDDDDTTIVDDATVVATPASTVASKGEATAKKARKKNKHPCGACQSRRKRCIPVSSSPRLCLYCQRSKSKECPPHVSGQAMKGVYGAGPPRKKSKVADDDGFIYENPA